jgi:hypothetical protein
MNIIYEPWFNYLLLFLCAVGALFIVVSDAHMMGDFFILAVCIAGITLAIRRLTYEKKKENKEKTAPHW